MSVKGLSPEEVSLLSIRKKGPLDDRQWDEVISYINCLLVNNIMRDRVSFVKISKLPPFAKWHNMLPELRVIFNDWNLDLDQEGILWFTPKEE